MRTFNDKENSHDEEERRNLSKHLHNIDKRCSCRLSSPDEISFRFENIEYWIASSINQMYQACKSISDRSIDLCHWQRGRGRRRRRRQRRRRRIFSFQPIGDKKRSPANALRPHTSAFVSMLVTLHYFPLFLSCCIPVLTEDDVETRNKRNEEQTT